MSGNLYRGTPGRTLAIFAACLAGVTILSIHKWWERRDFEEVHFPTGLGDTVYYLPSDAHFSDPLVKLPRPDGTILSLYRKNINAVEKSDERMLKLARPERENFWLYTDSHQKPDEQAHRFFVKTAEGKYVEFRTTIRESPGTEPAESDLKSEGPGDQAL